MFDPYAIHQVATERIAHLIRERAQASAVHQTRGSEGGSARHTPGLLWTLRLLLS